MSHVWLDAKRMPLWHGGSCRAGSARRERRLLHLRAQCKGQMIDRVHSANSVCVRTCGWGL